MVSSPYARDRMAGYAAHQREQHERDLRISARDVIEKIEAVQRQEFDFMTQQGMLYKMATLAEIAPNHGFEMRDLVEAYVTKGPEAIIDDFAHKARSFQRRNGMHRAPDLSPEEYQRVKIADLSIVNFQDDIANRGQWTFTPLYRSDEDVLNGAIKVIEKEMGMSLKQIHYLAERGPKPAPIPDDYTQIRMAMLSGAPAANGPEANPA